MKHIFYGIIACFSLLACEKVDDGLQEFQDGMRPIYSESGNTNSVSSEEPGAITQGSKIYIKSNFVYIVENGLGVHIIDNNNPSTPTDIRFLRINGITDIAVRNTTMYANQGKDIIAINIQDVMNVAVTERIENVYELDYDKFPIGYQGYFECVDNSKGIVVGWEEALLENPKCWR